jgi:hypothetical protein
MDDELMSIRGRVKAALQEAPYLMPWAFETAPASSENVEDGYLRKVREASFVLWLIGSHTTEPVEKEINEALASQGGRLLPFLLPAKNRDARTQDLLRRIEPHARYREIVDLDQLETEIEKAISDEITRALMGKPSVSRVERLDALGRESRARCIQKWQATGIELDLARKLANDIGIGGIPPHLLPNDDAPLAILAAEAGCGKSLACERFLQDAIAAQLLDATTPVPVFLTARKAVGDLQKCVLAASRGLGAPEQNGAMVVIDGADEAADGASLLLAEARELVHTWPPTRIVLSTRPLTQFDGISEARLLPRLDDPQAREVVALGAGRSISMGEQAGWSQPIKDAAQVPLFALLIGLHIARSGSAGDVSRTTLLAELAEHSLADATNDARGALRKLAILVIARGGDRVSKSELGGNDMLRRLEASRLVAVGDGEVWFPLTLMAQWFAAESLAEGKPTGDELATNAADLELWRYPLAILAATATHEQALSVIAPLAKAHPGFISQVVDESITRWEARGTAVPPQQEAGKRIRSAMTCWLSGLDPLRDTLHPQFRAGDKLPPLGVSTDGDLLMTGWYAGEDELAEVTQLPIDLVLGKQPAAKVAVEWPQIRGGTPSRQAAWALRWTLEELTGDLEYMLNERLLPLQGTNLGSARLWRAARTVLGLSESHCLPIAVSDATERVTTLVEQSGENIHRTQLHPIDLARFLERLAELRDEGTTEIQPVALEVEPSGRLAIPNTARNDIALGQAQAVYAEALRCYDQLTNSLFRPLRPFMQIAVLLPACLHGHIYARGDPSVRQFSTHIEWWLEPLPPDAESTVDITAPEPHAPEHRFMERWDEEAEEATVRARAYRPEQARWIGMFLKSERLQTWGPLAAEEIVYDWLWKDLGRIKWVNGQMSESHYKTLP